MFELEHGMDLLEEAQKNPNYDIYEMAGEILDTYFGINNKENITTSTN